jgi:hypothetical protein
MTTKRIYREIVSYQYAKRWNDLPAQLQVTLACGHNQWVRKAESLSRAISMPFRKKAVCHACMKSAQHCVQPTPLSLSSAETLGDNSRRG